MSFRLDPCYGNYKAVLIERMWTTWGQPCTMSNMSVTVQPEEAAWVPTDTFASRLVLVRRHLGLNYREAAAKCELSYTTWRTWERGSIPHDMPAVVTKISHALGVNRDWLMWGGSLSTGFSPVLAA